MEIDKFVGPTLEDAVEEVRQRWGSDAIILHVEKQRSPRKLFGQPKEFVTVTAKRPEKNQSQNAVSSSVDPSMLKELSFFREEVQELRATMRQMERIQWARTQVESKALQHPLLDFMVKKGLSCDFALELFLDWSGKNPSLDIIQCMSDLDRRLLRLGWGDLFPKDHGRCTLLLGLPGAGKTQLLIKIAARMRLMNQTEVLLVSGDMSRPGPSQELALYSEILQIPVTQIFDLAELKALAQQASPRTHILIDWKGVSPYSQESWKELEDLKKHHPASQIILTASLVSDLRNWNSLTEQFTTLPLVGVALTQADLEYRLGKIWEASRETGLPIAFVSTGKNVPGDFFEGKGFPFAKHFFHDYTPLSSTKFASQ